MFHLIVLLTFWMSCLSTGGCPPPPATPPIPGTPPKPTSGGNIGKAIFNEAKRLSSWQHQFLSLSCHLWIFLTGLDTYKLLTRLIFKLLVNTSRSSHLLITLIILDSASPIIITDLIEMLIEDSDCSRSEHKRQKRHMNLRFAMHKIFGDSEAIVSPVLNQTPLKYCKSFFRL